MTAHGFTELLAQLGVDRSYSRPRVSNDNPFSESQFHTLKYQPDYPGRFRDPRHGRQWCTDFFGWYNDAHHHEGLSFFTPADVFFGRVDVVAACRQAALAAAFAQHPERFLRGAPVVRRPPARVVLNPIDPGEPVTAKHIITARASTSQVPTSPSPAPPQNYQCLHRTRETAVSPALTRSGSESRPERVDLSALVRAIGAQLAATEPQREVSIVVQEDLSADADPRLMHVLFDNLIGNALKFTANVPLARIEFGSFQDVLFLRDNGASFDMAHASKLLGPFQRLHTVAEFPGTGIGLATAQRVVHRYGGRIWAEGKVGGGATFYFTLPSATGKASTRPTQDGFVH